MKVTDLWFVTMMDQPDCTTEVAYNMFGGCQKAVSRQPHLMDMTRKNSCECCRFMNVILILLDGPPLTLYVNQTSNFSPKS